MRTEALGLPNLELVTESDERHRIANPGMHFYRIRQDDTPFRIDLQNLACPEQRRRQLIPLVRIGRQRRQKRIDLVQKHIAACVQGRRVERRMNVEPLESILAKTARKDAGIDTRPFESNLFVKLDTKRFIGRSSRAPDCQPPGGS